MKTFGIRMLVIVVVSAIAFAAGCETGGEEGDRCNPLVHRDECDEGLACTAATCTVFYCCPRGGGPTSEPNCQNLAGCPDEDAGAPEPDAGALDASDEG